MIKCKIVSGCVSVVKKMPPKTSHRFRKVGSKKKTSRKKIAGNLLKNTNFRLSGSSLTFNIRSSKFCGTINDLQKFDVPMAVQVAKKTFTENSDQSNSSGSRNVEKSEDVSVQTSKVFLGFFSSEDSAENDRRTKAEEKIVDEKISKSIESDIFESAECVDLTLNDVSNVEIDQPEVPKNSAAIDHGKQKKKRGRKPKSKNRNSSEKVTNIVIVQSQESKDGRKSSKADQSSEVSSTKTDKSSVESVFVEVDEGEVMNEICILFEKKNNSVNQNEAKSTRKNVGVKSKLGTSKDFRQKSDSSLPVVANRKRARSDSEDQQPPKKKRKMVEKGSNKRRSVDKVKVKLSDKNRKRLSDGVKQNSELTPISKPPKEPISESPKGLISKSPKSLKDKNIGKTKKSLKAVDPNQKTILQYFLSSSTP